MNLGQRDARPTCAVLGPPRAGTTPTGTGDTIEAHVIESDPMYSTVGSSV